MCQWFVWLQLTCVLMQQRGTKSEGRQAGSQTRGPGGSAGSHGRPGDLLLSPIEDVSPSVEAAEQESMSRIQVGRDRELSARILQIYFKGQEVKRWIFFKSKESNTLQFQLFPSLPFNIASTMLPSVRCRLKTVEITNCNGGTRFVSRLKYHCLHNKAESLS